MNDEKTDELTAITEFFGCLSYRQQGICRLFDDTVEATK